MRSIIFIIFLGIAMMFFSGCSRVTGSVTELSKTLWGTSTKRLEIERANAISKAYVCEYDECFDAVLKLCEKTNVWEEDDWEYRDEEERKKAEKNISEQADKDQAFLLHLKSRQKRHIVVVGVPESVDTTEVGIFFNDIADGQISIEISSLSTPAKRKASKIVFKKLGENFQEVKYD